MSWQVGQRIVADATGVTVRGSRIAGGAQLHIDVAFRLVEWPWKENENGQLSLASQHTELDRLRLQLLQNGETHR